MLLPTCPTCTQGPDALGALSILNPLSLLDRSVQVKAAAVVETALANKFVGATGTARAPSVVTAAMLL
jgi:hypothetical protein